MQSLGVSFRGSMSSKAVALVPVQYGFRMPLNSYDRKVVEGLVKNGNLIYPKVHFGPDGEVLRSSSDPTASSLSYLLYRLTNSITSRCSFVKTLRLDIQFSRPSSMVSRSKALQCLPPVVRRISSILCLCPVSRWPAQ